MDKIHSAFHQGKKWGISWEANW